MQKVRTGSYGVPVPYGMYTPVLVGRRRRKDTLPNVIHCWCLLGIIIRPLAALQLTNIVKLPYGTVLTLMISHRSTKHALHGHHAATSKYGVRSVYNNNV